MYDLEKCVTLETNHRPSCTSYEPTLCQISTCVHLHAYIKKTKFIDQMSGMMPLVIYGCNFLAVNTRFDTVRFVSTAICLN